MSDLTLVTGGCGFIGSHLVDALVASGRGIRVLDVVEPQVHGEGNGYRNSQAEYIKGSVTDPNAVDEALKGVSSVVHLAAQVGVGQSMYEITRYVRNNVVGTAVLLEALEARRDHIESLVVASSMSTYGEGQYYCEKCDGVVRAGRSLERLRQRDWEAHCYECASPASSRPTSEEKPMEPDSIYAVTKRDQEELCLLIGRAYDIRTVSLRFFNVYGPRQSLSNPYTGVAAIFSSRILNGAPPLVFEDGKQSRDFIHVSDIVQGITRSLDADVGDVAMNLGTGRPTTVLEVAETLVDLLHGDVDIEVVGRFRKGDIRHCYADISVAERLIGYRPQVSFRDGMLDLVAWIASESPEAIDRFMDSTGELEDRGLVF